MIGTQYGHFTEIQLQDKIDIHFFSFKKTDTSFILYEHLIMDDLSEEKGIKKIVKNWRSDITGRFLMRLQIEDKFNVNLGFRVYLYMVIASRCKTFGDFREYSSIIQDIEDFEVMYWYWRIQINPIYAIQAFKLLFKE